MGLWLVAVFGGCLRSSFDAATGRFFEITRFAHEKKRGQLRFSAVNLLQPEKDLAVPARPGDLPGHRAERPEGGGGRLPDQRPGPSAGRGGQPGARLRRYLTTA